MRSIIFTSFANVIRFSAEGTEMLRESLSLCSHLKPCAGLPGNLPLLGGLLRQLLAVEPGVNPAWRTNVNFAFISSGLIPATATSGSCVSYRDGRGIDAIDHQLAHSRSQRSS